MTDTRPRQGISSLGKTQDERIRFLGQNTGFQQIWRENLRSKWGTPLGTLLVGERPFKQWETVEGVLQPFTQMIWIVESEDGADCGEIKVFNESFRHDRIALCKSEALQWRKDRLEAKEIIRAGRLH